MEDKSPGFCLRYKEGGTYTLDYTNSVFTATNENGKMFSVKLPDDGAVKQSFKSSSGASLVIEGNAKTRELITTNKNSGCRWKLTPE
jgi:hypothetical protein